MWFIFVRIPSMFCPKRFFFLFFTLFFIYLFIYLFLFFILFIYLFIFWGRSGFILFYFWMTVLRVFFMGKHGEIWNLFKSKVCLENHFRKWFWINFEVKSYCSVRLKIKFFIFLQIFEWQSRAVSWESLPFSELWTLC